MFSDQSLFKSDYSLAANIANTNIDPNCRIHYVPTPYPNRNTISDSTNIALAFFHERTQLDGLIANYFDYTQKDVTHQRLFALTAVIGLSLSEFYDLLGLRVDFLDLITTDRRFDFPRTIPEEYAKFILASLQDTIRYSYKPFLGSFGAILKQRKQQS